MASHERPRPLTRRTKNEDLCVEIALDIMAGQGWIDLEYAEWNEDGYRDELEAELRRLYRLSPVCQVPITFKKRNPQLHIDGVGHDPAVMWNFCATRPAEYLAKTWEFEQQMRYQRECAPRYACIRCGEVYGVHDTGWGRSFDLYELNDAGEFVGDNVRVCKCGLNLRDAIRLGYGEQLALRLFRE